MAKTVSVSESTYLPHVNCLVSSLGFNPAMTDHQLQILQKLTYGNCKISLKIVDGDWIMVNIVHKDREAAKRALKELTDRICFQFGYHIK